MELIVGLLYLVTAVVISEDALHPADKKALDGQIAGIGVEPRDDRSIMSSTSCIVSVCIVIETSQLIKFSLLLADIELNEQVQLATIFLVRHCIVNIAAGVKRRCELKRVASKG